MPRRAFRGERSAADHVEGSVKIPGLYASLLDAARRAVEIGDPRALLVDEPDDADLHSLESPINQAAQDHLAKLQRGEPMVIRRRRRRGKARTARGVRDVVQPFFGPEVTAYYVYPDDTVAPVGGSARR